MRTFTMPETKFSASATGISALVFIFAFFSLTQLSCAKPKPVVETPEMRILDFGFPIQKPDEIPAPEWNTIVEKNWEHIFLLLVQQGVNSRRLSQTFIDPRMPKRRALEFNIIPKESKGIYKGVNSRKNRRNALNFYQRYHREFDLSNKLYGVPKEVILAILQIESNCGRYTGKHRIFHRLTHLAAARAPDSIKKSLEFNMEKHGKDKVSLLKVAKRAKWLEDTFLPHAISVLRISDLNREQPLDVRGSIAGAIGLPQFLPGNVVKFGIDGDSNGRIELHTNIDAIHSVANFLKAHGWRRNISLLQQRKVLSKYNNSEAYVDTVLSMAEKLKRYTY